MYLLEIKILLIKMWYAIDCKIPLHNRDIETCALESVKYNNPFFSSFEVGFTLSFPWLQNFTIKKKQKKYSLSIFVYMGHLSSIAFCQNKLCETFYLQADWMSLKHTSGDGDLPMETPDTKLRIDDLMHSTFLWRF